MEMALIIALSPAVAIAIFIYQKDRHDREPVSLLLKLFLVGSLSAIPVYLIERILSFFNIFDGIFSTLYISFVIAGITEEYFKRLVVIKIGYKNRSYNEKLDGIVYCVFSSLGFATIENIVYVTSRLRTFLYTGISRGIFAVPSHVLFAITMGYYLSLSKFSKHEEHSRKYLAKSLYIPIILHGTYDFILMINIKALLIVFIGFVLYLWKTNLDRLDQYVEDSRIRNARK